MMAPRVVLAVVMLDFGQAQENGWLVFEPPAMICLT
jgi:hypothetical protein